LRTVILTEKKLKRTKKGGKGNCEFRLGVGSAGRCAWFPVQKGRKEVNKGKPFGNGRGGAVKLRHLTKKRIKNDRSGGCGTQILRGEGKLPECVILDGVVGR